MSQTVITLAFEQWKAQQGATGEAVLLDEFVFASVPGLDPSLPVNRSEALPPEGQIVYRQPVTRKGVVNENAVVHSVVLGADVGDFSFNWIGLINKASGTLAMIVHAPVQQKLKTSAGQQGNVLTRSFLMEYNGAQAETGINTPAETWQIDFTARMAGMDERQRLENMDIYGAAAFFGDGWLVGKKGAQYFVTQGAGYVAGLRAELAKNTNVTVSAKPVKVWIDVCWTGSLTSVWSVTSKLTVADTLADYVQSGVQHYVFALASIDADGVITDLRPKGSLDSQQGNGDFMRRDKNLSDVADVAKARASLSLERVVQRDSDTRILSPDGKSCIQITNAGWGARSVSDPEVTLALPMSSGGTGAKNAEDARKNLELGAAALLGVATPAQMVEGVAENLTPSVAAVMGLFGKRNFNDTDYIRIPDVPGGLVIQWGSALTATTGIKVTLPFPLARAMHCYTTANQTGDGNTTFQALTANSVFLQAYNQQGSLVANTTINWLVLGVSP